MIKTRTSSQRGVYKLRYAIAIYYRLGHGVDNARLVLARELGVDAEDIEILEDGRPQ